MATYTEEQIINAGGKKWSKGDIERVYVKSDCLKSLINFDMLCEEDKYLEKNTKALFQRVNSEGAWFNCKTNQLESKKVSVQAWFDSEEFFNL
jgi:hypothetical protein